MGGNGADNHGFLRELLTSKEQKERGKMGTGFALNYWLGLQAERLQTTGATENFTNGAGRADSPAELTQNY
jgi:hypothetical protein